MTLTSKQIHPDWTVGLTSEEKDRLITDLKKASSVVFLRIMKEMVKRKAESVLAQEDGNVNQYNNADWAYKQAHLNGNKQMIKWLDQVLDFVDK